MGFCAQVDALGRAAKEQSWECVVKHWNLLKKDHTIPPDPTRKRKHGMIEAEQHIDQNTDYMRELYVQCIRVKSLMGKDVDETNSAFYIKFILAPAIRALRLSRVKSAK